MLSYSLLSILLAIDLRHFLRLHIQIIRLLYFLKVHCNHQSSIEFFLWAPWIYFTYLEFFRLRVFGGYLISNQRFLLFNRPIRIIIIAKYNLREHEIFSFFSWTYHEGPSTPFYRLYQLTCHSFFFLSLRFISTLWPMLIPWA